MPEPSPFYVKCPSMEDHRKIQCSELVLDCSEALINTPYLESFRHEQTILHIGSRHEPETMSVLENQRPILHAGNADARMYCRHKVVSVALIQDMLL